MAKYLTLTLTLVTTLLGVSAASASAATMRIDATQLSTTAYRLDRIVPAPAANLGTFDGTVVQTHDLSAGDYRVVVGSALALECGPLTVTSAGVWEYPTGCDGFMAGRGSDMLVVRGYDIGIDASPLSAPIIFAGTFGLKTPFFGPRTLRLVPTTNPYSVQDGSAQVSACHFAVRADGTVGYPDELEGCLRGRGTRSVTFNGVPAKVDARPLSTTAFLMINTFGLGNVMQDSTVVQEYRLLPLAAGARLFQDGGQIWPLAANIGLDGSWSYATTSDGWVSGRGTGTLVIHGYPVEVDATVTAPGTFRIANAAGVGSLDRLSAQSLRLAPVAYRYEGSPFSFPWALASADGLLGYGDDAGPCVFGRGTSRLTVGCRMLAVADTSVIEGDAARFTISLSGPSPVDVTVDYATGDGSASAPGDYSTTSGNVTLRAGSTAATITVPVTDDALPEGDEEFKLTLSGARNATIDDANATGTILDDDEDLPPLDCSGVSASPDLLWPPNHELRQVTLTGAPADVSLAITGVTQDEPTTGLGSGDTAPDAQRTADPAAVRVRAERSGTGDGRVYSIAFIAKDSNGRECKGSTRVSVPHDMGGGRTAVDSGQRYDSMGG